jgi:hypothetical protein
VIAIKIRETKIYALEIYCTHQYHTHWLLPVLDLLI